MWRRTPTRATRRRKDVSQADAAKSTLLTGAGSTNDGNKKDEGIVIIPWRPGRAAAQRFPRPHPSDDGVNDVNSVVPAPMATARVRTPPPAKPGLWRGARPCLVA